MSVNDAGDRIYGEFFNGELAVQIDLNADTVDLMDNAGRVIVHTTLAEANSTLPDIATLIAGAIVQDENPPEEPPEEVVVEEGDVEEVQDPAED